MTQHASRGQGHLRASASAVLSRALLDSRVDARGSLFSESKAASSPTGGPQRGMLFRNPPGMCTTTDTTTINKPDVNVCHNVDVSKPLVPTIIQSALNNPMGFAMKAGRSGLRRSPLDRFMRWLKSNRPIDTHSTAEPSARAKTERACRGLFPSHLPQYSLLQSNVAPQGGWSQKRLRELKLAGEWTDSLISYFSFIELGSPKCLDVGTSALGSWDVTPKQKAAGDKLFLEILREVRRRESNSDPPPRNPISLLKLLDRLCDSDMRASDVDAVMADMATAALEVDPKRVSVPQKAGGLCPSKYLTSSQSSIYTNRESRVLDPPPSILPKCCLMVSPDNEGVLREILLKSGMCVLIKEADIERRPDGRLLLSGLFAVPHKADRDRLIVDKRPPNAGETRLKWARLPLGSQMCHLLLRPSQHIRGSGDDLSNYFYQLKESPQMLARSAIGRRIQGSDVVQWGGVPGVSYRLAVRVVAMGGGSAVDIAQATHEGVLRSEGCLQKSETLVYGSPLPMGAVLEGLYIDDHLVAALVERSRLKSMEGRDFDIIKASHLAYEEAGLARSMDKSYGFGRSSTDGGSLEYNKPAEASFKAWGTCVNSEPGEACVDPSKRKIIGLVIGRLLEHGKVTLHLFQKVLGSLVHPFQHRKEFMSCLHRSYVWASQLPTSGEFKIPADIRDELFVGMLLLPLAVGKIRRPVHTTVYACDATPSTGGTVTCDVSVELAEGLFQSCEFKGGHVRLDGLDAHAPDCYTPNLDPAVIETVKSMDWRVTRSHTFRETAHVNLQETNELIGAFRDMCDKVETPSRFVVGSDSRVCIGAWTKGRSSSFQLNGLLRRTLGYHVMSGHSVHLIWLPTDVNPADDPSRFVPLRTPTPPRPWLGPLLKPEAPRSFPSRKVAKTLSKCLEVFSGKAPLSKSLGDIGLNVDPPMDAYVSAGQGRTHSRSGLYVRQHDLFRPEVVAKLRDGIIRGRLWYVHFGVPCSTWGRAGRLNKGTRRVGREMGDGSLSRECDANSLSHIVSSLCILLQQHGGIFTIENPHDSYLWNSVYISSLRSKVTCYFANFDQCAYGLRLPGSAKHVYCKKSTRILSNYPYISQLDRRCPGKCEAHQHEWAWGSVAVKGKSVKLAAQAGHYPTSLCKAWAKVVHEAWVGRSSGR